MLTRANLIQTDIGNGNHKEGRQGQWYCVPQLPRRDIVHGLQDVAQGEAYHQDHTEARQQRTTKGHRVGIRRQRDNQLRIVNRIDAELKHQQVATKRREVKQNVLHDRDSSRAISSLVLDEE